MSGQLCQWFLLTKAIKEDFEYGTKYSFWENFADILRHKLIIFKLFKIENSFCWFKFMQDQNQLADLLLIIIQLLSTISLPVRIFKFIAFGKCFCFDVVEMPTVLPARQQ